MNSVAASSTPRYSLIIPAYNEAAYLPRLLDTVDRARRAYAGGPAAIEVVVADNASTDATPQIARDRGCRTVSVAERVIACVRNRGAAAARGEILAFIDADSQIHPETFNEIDRVLSAGMVIGGTTGSVLERWSPGLACTYAVLMLLGIVIRGVRGIRDPGIDTGVVFCRRRDFVGVGGYRERYLYGEDVRLLLDLLSLGRKSRRRIAGQTGAKAIMSTRKFDQHGDWHYFTMAPRVAWQRLLGRSDVARRYWYDAR